MKKPVKRPVGIGLLIVFLGVLLAGAWCCNQVSAQATSKKDSNEATIRISPPTRRIAVDPGSTCTKDQQGGYIIKVTNRGKDSFMFTMSAKPYSMKDTKYESPSYDGQTSYTQLSRWITFPKQEYTLAAGETVDVPFVVTVPEDVPGGGQYAVIFASTTGSKKAADGSIIEAIYQPGMIVFARVSGETREEGKVESMKIEGFQPPKYEAGANENPLSSTALVKNSGNIDFTVTSSMVVSSIFSSEEVAKVNSEKLTVFPGTSRQFSLSWKDSPSIGIYNVKQSLTVLGKEYTTSNLVVVVSLVLIAIVAICLVLIVVGLVVFFKLRRGGSKKVKRPSQKLRLKSHDDL
ncbi:MAG: hypothetical protein LBG75_01630 [Candidatus Nomurabacteria bacterium]|jgi:hypothetical protein|nr:hypothetical protein [Candidatus Nomurabacteria bacterium]